MSVPLFPFDIWRAYQPSFSNFYSIRHKKPNRNFQQFSSPASSSFSRFCPTAIMTKHHSGMPEGFIETEWNFLRIRKQRISDYLNRITINKNYKIKLPEILLTVRSQWPYSLRRGSAEARFLGFWFRIPLEAWMFVLCECWMLAVRGLCDGPIPRSGESYRVWCVWM